SRTVAAAHDQRAATRRPIARTPHGNVEAARDAGGAGPPVGSASRRSDAVAAGSPSEVAGATPAPRVGAWRAVGAGDELGDDEPALREVLAQVPRPRRHAPVPHRFEARSAEAGRPTTPQSYEARPRLVALSTPQPADWARPDEAVRAASPSSAYAAAVRDGDASRIKGSLFLALADHLEATSGPGSYERLVASLEPSVRAELPSVVLPLAWLPLRLYQRLLAAADRLWGGSEGAVASAVGEATASRELPVTHRLLLHSATPATAAARLPQLLRSYHDASGFGVEPIAGGARVDLGSWQPPDAVYERMLAGFARRTVEMAGGRDVRATIHASRAAGDPRSVLVLRWR
ncbi:MAG: hypothetical protein NZ898_16955, partial [Myxococcota bacterium]|nr:hypothetical protein [Myxococcota bacterium]